MTVTAKLSGLPIAGQGGDGDVPRHIAIIMDGNGRWARARGLPRTEGHRRGVDVVRRIVGRAAERGVSFLTLYSFSSENWSRPASEVSYLLGLLRRFVQKDLQTLHERGIRVRIIGSRENLAADILAMFEDAEERTRDNTGMTLVVAFNYGARCEIVEAAQSIARDVAAGRLDPAQITETTVDDRLYTSGIPNPDLILRTSGEQRLSNFLLWQAAYSEFLFVPDLWPDFDEAALDRAIGEYAKRDRRFGGVASQAAQ
ncbi:isoprenyl transferase [Breoghania sp. L-A4]|uniref:isoprenyl transferase n=1 Tax=Breoghania sp. L-A4 TaxID=2304600 RepID=UPI000E35B922|nr:isoprenyl transferase [Breoghania sp. L-A4]AXS40412.1 isoprenyl transferase [Breoghania sp. L-A4]